MALSNNSKVKKKETRGGKRPLSGRKKAPYETKTIAFPVDYQLVRNNLKNKSKIL